MQVCKAHILPLFNDIYLGLQAPVTDLDNSVRTNVEIINRLLKDVVIEHWDKFDIFAFLELFRERLMSKNPFMRTFNLGWLSTLHGVHNLKLIRYLPDLLDGLFLILADEQPDIYVP